MVRTFSETSIRRANGVGLGLRAEFAKDLLAHEVDDVRWLEIHPENYIGRGGKYAAWLEQAEDVFPILAHGLTLGLAGTDPFDRAYVKDLRALLERLHIPFYSDHLCFASFEGQFAHDLLPVPHTLEAAQWVAQRIDELTQALGRPVALENVSYYLPNLTPMSELDFILEIFERAPGARMLLDVNNVYVNSQNHGFDAGKFIAALPTSRIVQLHVAGHWVRPDGIIIDTHSENMVTPVLDLLEQTYRCHGQVPTLLERDGNYPDWDNLLIEFRRVSGVWNRVFDKAAQPSSSAGLQA